VGGFQRCLTYYIPSNARASYLLQNFQTGYGVQPTSFTMGIGGLFLGDKAARGWV